MASFCRLLLQEPAVAVFPSDAFPSLAVSSPRVPPAHMHAVAGIHLRHAALTL
jgi:hypothetical protein